MRYIKYDKDGGLTLKSDFDLALTNLQDAVSDIHEYCDSIYYVEPDKISCWEDIKDELGDIIGGQWKYNHKEVYKKYQACLRKIQGYGRDIKNGAYTDGTRLRDSVQGLNTLIDEFDNAANFSLEELLTGKTNLVVRSEQDGSSVIYYLDENGQEIELSQLLNAFFTETGMTMDGMLQAALAAESLGIEFTAEYQKQILDNVKSAVGEMTQADAFGVVTKTDINNVASSLNIDANALWAYAGDTGAKSTGGMTGAAALTSAYDITSFINEVPLSKTYSLDGSLKSNDMTINTGEGTGIGNPFTTGDGTSPTGGGTGMPGPGIDETDPSGPQGTLPPGTNPGTDPGTNPETDPGVNPEGDKPTVNERILELLDLSDVEGFEGFLPQVREDFDDMARKMFETMDTADLTAFRNKTMETVHNLIDSNNVKQIFEDLKDYGYSDRDAKNFVDVEAEVVKDPDAVTAAYVSGEQNKEMAKIANNLAKENGVTDFKSSHGSDPSYSDHKNGSVNANIANMHKDPAVSESANKYEEAKTAYKVKADEVKVAAEEANEALKEVKEIPEKYGKDTSKWTDEQVEEYENAKENYEEAQENYEEKVEEYNEAEKEYDEAYEEYEEAQEKFEDRIKENAQSNQEHNEERPVPESKVDLDTEEVLPGSENTPSGEQAPTGGVLGGENPTTASADAPAGTGTTPEPSGEVPAADTSSVPAPGGSEGTGAVLGGSNPVSTSGETVTISLDEGSLLGDAAPVAEGGEATSGSIEVGTYANDGVMEPPAASESPNGIESYREENTTPEAVETSGMDSQTTIEVTTDSQTGQVIDAAGTGIGLSTEQVSQAAIASQVQREEQSAIESSQAYDSAPMANPMTVGNAGAATGFTTTQTASTLAGAPAAVTGADGIQVESNGNEVVVNVGNDVLLNPNNE